MKRNINRLKRIAKKLAARNPPPNIFEAMMILMDPAKPPLPKGTPVKTRQWAERLVAVSCGRPDPHPHMTPTKEEN